jgi:hypothetical protein
MQVPGPAPHGAWMLFSYPVKAKVASTDAPSSSRQSRTKAASYVISPWLLGGGRRCEGEGEHEQMRDPARGSRHGPKSDTGRPSFNPRTGR